MKIAILGFGKQGRSAYDYWKSEDNEITICDRDPEAETPAGSESQLGSEYLKHLDKYDLIVRSPGIHPKEIVKANEASTLDKVTSVTNEFFKVCPTKNIIGVTGTKGKGTTSTLIARMLEAAGKTVHLGGNIGTPPFELLTRPNGDSIEADDWVVLELSNFQLIDLKYAPKIAVCVMLEPEHLNWHPDLEEYFFSKKQLFANQKSGDIAIYYAQNKFSESTASASHGKLIPYYKPPGAIIENDDIVIDKQSICSTDEIKLPGPHNWQNICAAVTVLWQITKDIKPMRQVATTFDGLEHRLELIREFKGVKYYDDSFGTTPGTAKVAIEAFPQPKIVILGGRGKDVPLDPMCQAVVDNNVKKVIAIGEKGPEITEILHKLGYNDVIKGKENMEEIVKQARAATEPGDIVLLSTGCASFDMFSSYEERGNKFKQSVLELV